ncbi:MAG: hypothetical protein GY718_10060 [Lentisphaerae bacterium]|nr:hypothetical protein [Lentisphaerota bacterium]
MKPIFYYFRDEKDRPVVTICLQPFEHEAETLYARGLAIASDLEFKHQTFSKKRGRQIAYGRANKAILKHINEYSIDNYHGCIAPISRTRTLMRLNELRLNRQNELFTKRALFYKGFVLWKEELNEIEKGLLDDR